MEAYNFFIDREGRLRSGWRVTIFVVAFYVCAQMGQAFLFASGRRVLGLSSTEMIRSEWSYVTGALASAISALLVGWACGRLLEGLPFRALGCSRHRGWLKNLGIGTVVGHDVRPGGSRPSRFRDRARPAPPRDEGTGGIGIL